MIGRGFRETSKSFCRKALSCLRRADSVSQRLSVVGKVSNMKRPPLPEVRGLSRIEAAQYLGVSPGHIDKLERLGVLSALRFGRRRLFDRKQIDDLFEESRRPIGVNCKL